MGGALLESWHAIGCPLTCTVIDPVSPSATVPSIHEAHDALSTADIILLAVKPQTLPDLCPALARLLPESALVLSIAAGTRLETFAGWFGARRPVIRAMPNTPAAIGKGITVAVPNAQVSPAQKHSAQILLESTGHLLWITEESLMDAVTALSGSGPAYVFYLIESLSRAGVSLGLSPEISAALARQTVIGSAALAESQSGVPPEQLRHAVTSPNGTTAAGLAVLMDGRFDEVLQDTLHAACARSKAL